MRATSVALCVALALSSADAARPRRALLQPMASPSAAPSAASSESGNGAVKAMEAQSMMVGTGNPVLLSGAGAVSGPPAVGGEWITTSAGNSVWAMAPPENTGACCRGGASREQLRACGATDQRAFSGAACPPVA